MNVDLLMQRLTRFVPCLLLLAATCLLSACGQKSVATVSTESEADEMIDVLRENNFEVEKVEIDEEDQKRWRVMVDEGWPGGGGDVALAIQVLHDNGLPRPADKGLEGAYDEKGIFTPESAQQAQRLKELKTEIERHLRAIPSVTRASVNVVLPENDSISLNPYPASASVLIVHKDAKPPFTAEQIQNMVARSVPNLSPEKVSVSLVQRPARPLPRRDIENRRRSNLILAICVGLIALLLFLLTLLLLQTRRQRARLAELLPEMESSAKEGEEAAAPQQQPPPSLKPSDATPRQLAVETAGTAPAPLPARTTTAVEPPPSAGTR